MEAEQIKMVITREKECFCHTCKKAFHYLGITRHRAKHRDRKENCVITYTYGDTWTHLYAEKAGFGIIGH